MHLRRSLFLPVASLALVGVLTGCGGGDDSASETTAADAAVTTTRVTAPNVFGATPAGCQADKTTLEVAVEAYAVMNGSQPPDEAALVSAGLLVHESEWYMLGPDGGVVVDPAGTCPS